MVKKGKHSSRADTIPTQVTVVASRDAEPEPIPDPIPDPVEEVVPEALNSPKPMAQRRDRKKKQKTRVAPRPLGVAKEADIPRLAESPDKVIVQRAVRDIYNILERTVHHGMVEVGEYVLKVFYADSAELVKSHAPSKHASLRGLVEQCGSHYLPVSRSWLSGALGIAIQARELEARTFADDYRRLSPSHRVVLLPLGDQYGDIKTLAARATKSKWSVRKLKKAVANLREKRGTMKSPQPFYLRSLKKSLSLWESRTKEETSGPATLVRQIPEEKLDEAAAMLEKLEKELLKFREALEKRLGN